MNKYLKILALSGSVLGAVAPIAIKTDSNNTTNNNDLYEIYENVEKMQNIVPKLSKINYKLEVGEIQDTNVKFISTDDMGEETDLTNQETINYLNETLEQTNAEYEQLKQTLTAAIKDTMDYLDSYKQNETELTNEQKVYIKEHLNSIKFLAETLENLSEDVICTIDGCEDCDDSEEFSATASKYISVINDLDARIQALQNSLSSLQFINNITNPYFFAGYRYAPNHIYGFHYTIPELDEDNIIEDSEDNNLNINNNTNNTDNDNIQDDISNANPDINDIQNNETQENTTENEEGLSNQENIEDNQVEQVEQNSTEDNTTENNEDTPPTTFGLKSNIDTYAPTKRNIDTFFNTALYNKEYMNGGGYNMPYGYGYGVPYGMPYGNGYYGQPYGMSGLNSNIVNRKVIEDSNQNYVDNTSPISHLANVENEVQEENQKPKKFRPRRAKNVDTYTGTTIQSNINTMGESKISNFFKEKFNNFRNKMKNQKDNKNINQENNLQDNSNNDNSIENDKLNNNLLDNNLNNIDNQVDLADNKKISETNSSNTLNINNSNLEQSIDNDNNLDKNVDIIDNQVQTNINDNQDLIEEKQIKAK